MQEIVINNCYGGFGLSLKALYRYAELKGIKLYIYVQTQYRFSTPAQINNYMRLDTEDEKNKYTDDGSLMVIFYTMLKDLGKNVSILPSDSQLWFYEGMIKRDDKHLVQVVKELKDDASSKLAKLKIVKVPDNIKWTIEEYDGLERVEEEHRSWS